MPMPNASNLLPHETSKLQSARDGVADHLGQPKNFGSHVDLATGLTWDSIHDALVAQRMLDWGGPALTPKQDALIAQWDAKKKASAIQRAAAVKVAATPGGLRQFWAAQGITFLTSRDDLSSWDSANKCWRTAK